MPEAQSRFRPKGSVATALACAQADWDAAKSQGYSVAIMAYDLSATFDMIGLGQITEQLENFGVVGTPIKWITSYSYELSITHSY